MALATIAAAPSLSNLERGEYQPVDVAGAADAADATTMPRYPRQVFAAGTVVALALVLVLALVGARRSSTGGSAGAVADVEVKASADVVTIEGAMADAVGKGGGAWSAWGQNFAKAVESTFIPSEDRRDDNPCEDDEELHAALCYKKCSLLTNGSYPVRCTAFSCSKANPCLLDNQDTQGFIPGTGYDVNAHNGLPHRPGACLIDEEYLVGRCYKKCKLLTNGSYPYRTGALTCCKDNDIESCFDFVDGEDRTSAAFNVGGGRGDHDASTPAYSHGPIQNLTQGRTHDANPPNNTALEMIEPEEHAHDGNKCEDTEEEYAGLCYSKCSNLTGGDYPIRTTAFSCCKSRPCGIVNQRESGSLLDPCTGFDVNGHGGCPHAPGACLLDEELWLGLCYKKCTALTSNDYPYRSSPVSCCKSKVESECIPSAFHENVKVKTSDLFAVGGGSGDSHRSTPFVVHRPLAEVTEAVA